MAEPSLTLAALLRWYADSGVDASIGEAPIDRFAMARSKTQESQAVTAGSESRGAAAASLAPVSVRGPEHLPAPAPALPAESPPAPAMPLGTAAAAAKAQSLAASCHSLAELKAAIAAFDGLSLRATATNLVFADGNPDSGLMLVGEAPGAEEDRLGLPFVGASGQLLDRMLASIGRGRESAYITNIVNWRPPGNRKPQPQEIAISLPFVERHIELVQPKAVVLLGDTAARALLGKEIGISRLRGQWFELGLPRLGHKIPVIATYHPAFLLRTPAQKRQSWRDMRLARDRVANPKTLHS